MNVTRSEPWRLFDLLHRDLIEVPGRFRAAIEADGGRRRMGSRGGRPGREGPRRITVQAA